MPRYGGNPLLKGNKNSGRRSAYEEFYKISVINRLWEKVHYKVAKSDELTDFDKDLIKHLLPKTIKQGLDIQTPALTINEVLKKFGGK